MSGLHSIAVCDVAPRPPQPMLVSPDGLLRLRNANSRGVKREPTQQEERAVLARRAPAGPTPQGVLMFRIKRRKGSRDACGPALEKWQEACSDAPAINRRLEPGAGTTRPDIYRKQGGRAPSSNLRKSAQVRRTPARAHSSAAGSPQRQARCRRPSRRKFLPPRSRPEHEPYRVKPQRRRLPQRASPPELSA